MRAPARIAAALLAGLGVVALLGQLWTPWDVGALDLAARLAPPTAAHPLGTDQLGRDLLSRLMAGAGPALGCALAATALGAVLGVPLGLLAAERPGWVDEGVARAGDLLFAFPALVLALLLVAALGPGEDRLALAIGLAFAPVFLRVTRAAARALLARPFVAAARLAGRGGVGIAWDHLLPNLRGVLLAQGAVQLALALLAEAGLAFLGLGTQPPAPSWGRMVADAQTLIGVAPRLALLPGLLIVATVAAVTVVADDLQRRLP